MVLVGMEGGWTVRKGVVVTVAKATISNDKGVVRATNNEHKVDERGVTHFEPPVKVSFSGGEAPDPQRDNSQAVAFLSRNFGSALYCTDEHERLMAQRMANTPH